jgi:hypothetical protein
MKVVAIKPAFYNGARIRVGDEVEVADDFKAAWAVKTQTVEAKAAAKQAAKPARQEPKALSQVGKGEDKSFIDAHQKADLA